MKFHWFWVSIIIIYLFFFFDFNPLSPALDVSIGHENSNRWNVKLENATEAFNKWPSGAWPELDFSLRVTEWRLGQLKHLKIRLRFQGRRHFAWMTFPSPNSDKQHPVTQSLPSHPAAFPCFTLVSHSFHIRFTFVSHFLTNFAVNWMNQRPLSALLSASARLGPPPPVSARLCPVLRRIVPRCQLNARVIGSIWLIRVNNRSDLTYTTLSEPLPQNQQQWRYCPPICRRNSRPNKRVNNARAVLYTTEQDNDREMARNWFRFRIANFLFRQWNGQPLTYNRKKKTNKPNKRWPRTNRRSGRVSTLCSWCCFVRLGWNSEQCCAEFVGRPGRMGITRQSLWNGHWNAPSSGIECNSRPSLRR